MLKRSQIIFISVLIFTAYLIGVAEGRYEVLGSMFASHTDSIGDLSYTLPGNDFYHGKNDVVTNTENGKEQITAKIYSRHTDMTEIFIGEKEYDDNKINEFAESDKNNAIITKDHIPESVDKIIAKSDCGPDKNGNWRNGHYFDALVVMKDHKHVYQVMVENGKDPYEKGVKLISSFKMKKSGEDKV